MADKPVRVLLIEDNPADARLVAMALADGGGARFEVKTAARLKIGLDYLRHDQFDAVLLDLSLPDCSREETITRVTAAAPRIPIVVLTGLDDERISREIVKRGAQDYLVKGQFDARLLSRSLFYAIERKRTEEVIARARDEALEAVGLKAAFLANMSHEIRTPMNAIIGMTRMLLDTSLDPDQHEFAEAVWSSAHSLLGILNDILDFSKVSAGKLRLDEVEFSPGENLESAVELFAELVQRGGIEMATFVDDAVPASLRGDPVRLRQVLVNLVGNAVKFIESGEVSITLECVSATRTEAVLRWSVRDTGPGIPQESQAHLFQAFYQADSSSTRRHGGTGLGLAISAEIVARMGGEIGVESIPGQGSNFWFTARFKLQPGDCASAAARPSARLRGMTVLLAAAEGLGASFMARQLESWGVKCLRTTTAAQTLETIAARRPGIHIDAILLACELGAMDAVAMAREISSCAGYSGAPMVGFCRMGKRPDAAAMRAVGLVAALAMPVRQSQLVRHLGEIAAHTAIHSMRAGTAEGTERGPQLRPLREIAQSLPTGIRQRARILVAEDHAVNRRVGLKMLERLGYHADSVSNGREALEALRRNAYDAVLMDCQMPEMDGYEATREIRREIGDTAKVAIIGLTAHALAGDRQKCLDAGMDDYLRKPFLPEDLNAILSRWLRRPSVRALPAVAAPPADPAAAPAPESMLEPPAIDSEAIRHLEAATDDGAEFVRELIGVFLADLDNRLGAMRLSAGADDADTIAQAAHALKGSSGHFGANRLVALCRELEQLCRAGSIDAAAEGMISAIEAESVRVRVALANYRAPSAAVPAD